MKSSKILQLLVIVTLVLSFTVTPAAAQFEPQEGTADEDGELVVEVLPAASGNTGLQVGQAGRVDSLPGLLLSQDSIVGVDAIPLSPTGLEFVQDKTPTLYFTKDAGATKYQIELWDVFKGQVLYSIKSSGNCTLSECSITPTTKLKNYDITYTKGFYSWRVRSKTGSGWGSYSAYAYFLVVSSGFNSTFDSHAKKWMTVSGDWFRTDSGILKTKGIANNYSSVLHKELFIDDFEVNARMKAKGGTSQFQGIILAGYPEPLSAIDEWYDGIYFLYENNSTGVFIRQDGGNTLWTGWSVDSDLDPTGWNELVVVVDSPNAYFYINGELSWTLIGFSDELALGFVGMTHYKFTSEKAPLSVDWIKLSYTPDVSAESLEPELEGVNVIDFNNLSPDFIQGGSPFEPAQ